jgi:tetratricopeptide (TPR) repeat protein
MAILTLLILVTATAIAQPPVAQPQNQEKKKAVKLKNNRPQERTLGSGETHDYRIKLKRGQFLRVLIEPQGVSLTTTLLDPKNNPITELEFRKDATETDPLIAVAEIKGEYRLRIQTSEKASGRYRITVAELRAASEKDRNLAGAMRAFESGVKLRREADQLRDEAARSVKEKADELKKQTDGKLREAITSFQRTITLSGAAGNRVLQARAHEATGIAWTRLNDWKQGIDAYTQALKLWREEKKNRNIGVTLSRLGVAYAQTGNREKALECYTEAREIWRGEKDAARETFDALISIGILSGQTGKKAQAAEAFDEAARVTRDEKDAERAAGNLNRLSVQVIQYLGSAQKAVEFNTLALERWKEVSDQKKSRAGQADTLRRLGFLTRQLDRKPEAIAYLEQSLQLWQQDEKLTEEAYTLSEMGRVYAVWGRNQEALKHLEQSKQRWQQAHERLSQGRRLSDNELFNEAGSWNNLGTVLTAVGKNQEAYAAYQRAIDLFREIKDDVRAAIILSNMGGVYLEFGDYQKAIGNYEEALETFLKAGKTPPLRLNQAGLIINIGSIYESVGDKEKGLEYYERALKEYRDVMDSDTLASALHNIGRVSNALGRTDEALKYHDQAMAIFKKTDDPLGIANTLRDMSEVYDGLAKRQTDPAEQRRQWLKAAENLKQALDIARKMENQSRIAEFLTNLGEIYNALGEQPQAQASLNEALPLRRAIGDRSGEAKSRYHLARVERDQGNHSAAIEQIQQAIELVESLRTGIVREGLRAAYFSSVQDYYEFYIDLLMRRRNERQSENYDARALQLSERARARSLLDLLAEARDDVRSGVAPELLERERDLQRQLNARAKEQSDLLLKKNTPEQLATLSQSIDEVTRQLGEVREKIRQTSPRYAQLTQPQPLGLKEIQQQVLDSETLLLEYSLGKERSWLWAVTPAGMTSYELPARAIIEEAANHYLELLTARQPREGEAEQERKNRIAAAENELPKAAEKLSRMLLAPALAQLSKPRLLVVGDGVLQTLPFGALPKPAPERRAAVRKAARKVSEKNQPVIVSHEVVYLPSASTLAVLRREIAGRAPAPKLVAVVADPVFDKDDERLTHPALKGINEEIRKSSDKNPTADVSRILAPRRRKGAASSLFDAHVPRLKGTRREAEAIMALAPVEARRQALDFEASRATATSPDLSQYRYLHFATHGFLSDEYPELSGIIFSMIDEKGQPQDGFLRAHEIFNLNLPAELIVLSACQTGLGDEIRGEGMVGLTRAFMYAGAPRLVVSLWNVSDQATAELMKRFYAGILGPQRLAPAKALQAAQISMLRDSRWRAPYYWSAFVLQGEWRGK